MRVALVTTLLFVLPLSAATLHVQIDRNGFDGPIEIAVAPREEGRLPEWPAPKTLAAGASSIAFSGLAPGLYTVLARGPQPLQRLTANANVGAAGATARLVIPKTNAALRVTLAGEPLPRATVTLTHDELRWNTELTTNDGGRFAGALWEPGAYTAAVRRDRATAPHIVDVTLGTAPLVIDVPDRHIGGRITAEDGKPVAGALVALRSESGAGSVNVRTQTAPDGRFEFFGVPAGAHSLFARATSYLQSDAVTFELRGRSAKHTVDLTLARGVQRDVRVVDDRGAALPNAMLFAACDGHVKSTSVTNAEGRGSVALPAAGSCAVYAVPKEGSLGIAHAAGSRGLVIPVPKGSSSLDLTLRSEAGDAFTDISLLMRIDGVVVPPAVARQLTSLITDDHGHVALERIPPGTYEFWPYRTEAEARMLYDVAGSFAAPIAVTVKTGENDATVKFKARR